MRTRGDLQTVQKSTKGADLSRKVSEMKKKIGNRNHWKKSVNRPNCVKLIGGQKLPTVFGPTNGPKGRDYRVKGQFNPTPDMSTKLDFYYYKSVASSLKRACMAEMHWRYQNL